MVQYVLHTEITIKAFCCNFSMYKIIYLTCMYNRLPENEPSDSKHIEDITNSNIRLENVHFLLVLYNYNIMYVAKIT